MLPSQTLLFDTGMAWDNRYDDDNNMVDRIAGEGALSERSVDLDTLLVCH